MKDLTTDVGYEQLLSRISDVYTTGQARAHQAIHAHITETYWQIGHDIGIDRSHLARTR